MRSIHATSRQAVIGLVVLLAACAGPGANPNPPSAADGAEAAEEDRAPVEEPTREDEDAADAPAVDEDGTGAPAPSEAAVEALAFVAPTLEGASFDGRDVAGDHVVLWMWAPW